MTTEFDRYYISTRRALANAKAACLFLTCERETALEVDAELIEKIRSWRSQFAESLQLFHNHSGDKLIAEKAARLVADLEEVSAQLAAIDDGRILIDGIF
jgi:hypothetical protein